MPDSRCPLVFASPPYFKTTQWEESARAVARTNQVIERLEESSLESKDEEEVARRFIATPDRLDLARCREALSQAKERDGELENPVAHSPPATEHGDGSASDPSAGR